MPQSRMIERNRTWKRRLGVTGVAAFVGLTAMIGKQAEHAAPVSAQDQLAPPATTANLPATASDTAGVPSVPSAQAATPSFSIGNSSVAQQPIVPQAPITQARTRTGSSRG